MIATDRDEWVMDRQARADERAFDRETQRQLPERLNQVLIYMSPSQKDFLRELNRVPERNRTSSRGTFNDYRTQFTKLKLSHWTH
jgi:hypothetical protein